MKNFLFIIFFALIAVVFEISLINLWGARYLLSILVPLVFLLSISKPFDQVIMLSALCGLIFDIASGNNIFFMTIFLIFEALLVFSAKRHLISFKNPLVILVSLIFLGELKAILNLLIFWWKSFTAADFIKIIVVNFVFALFVAFAFLSGRYLIERRKLTKKI